MIATEYYFYCRLPGNQQQRRLVGRPSHRLQPIAALFVFSGEDIVGVFLMMNSKYFSRISRTATITLAAALALVTMTGCFGSPRATDTVAGAAIGAGTGALIGGSEGSPGTGALIGGLGGGVVGYIVGTETEHYNYNHGYGGYGPYGYYGGY